MKHENTLKNPNNFPSIKVILLICGPIIMAPSSTPITIPQKAYFAAISARKTAIIITSITTR
jgi:hypothetical protein